MLNFLEQKILDEAVVKPGDILKVDHFLNHQVDVAIIRKIALELKRRFDGVKVDRVVTIEASGISIAIMVADVFQVPMVFAKKAETSNSTDAKYVSRAFSYTHRQVTDLFISRPYIHAGEKVLIVDDFLADGQAAYALIDMVHQAGAEVAGVGVAIEKGYQGGGQKLRADGYHLESVAIIDAMDCEHQTIVLHNQDETAS